MESVNSNEPVSIRFIAVTGAKTQRGGTVYGSAGLVTCDNPCVLEGDTVIYPDGSESTICEDITTGMATTPTIENKALTFAATGTAVNNGDSIVDAGQYRLAVFDYANGQSAIGVLDEEEVSLMKARGLI